MNLVLPFYVLVCTILRVFSVSYGQFLSPNNRFTQQSEDQRDFQSLVDYHQDYEYKGYCKDFVNKIFTTGAH